MSDLKFDPTRFVIDSHRGAFKEGLLENSVASFTQSFLEGANCVECDIRLTKDRQIALVHNKTIDHIAGHATKIPEFSEFGENPSGPVSDHTLTYLKALEFENDAKIMDLPDLLDLLKKLKVGAQIELKEGGYEDIILKSIEEAEIAYEDSLGPIVCTSFNYFAVMRLVKKAKKYNIPLYTHDGKTGLAFGFQGIGLGPFYGKWILQNFHKKNIWGGMTYYKFMPIHRIADAHKNGVKFCPRIEDNKELIYAYLDAGVDGIETDNVPFIRQCCEDKGIELWPLPKL